MFIEMTHIIHLICYIMMMAPTKFKLAEFFPTNKNILAPFLPYVAVGIGLLVLNSAWIAILVYHLGAIIILFSSGYRTSFPQILKIKNYTILFIMALLGALGGAILYLIWPFLAIPQDTAVYLQDIGLTKTAWPYFIGYFIIINPLVEELYWRSYLGGNSKRIVVNDLLFSGYHILVLAGKMDIIWLVIVFIILSLGAWFWRQANKWNHGILTSVASHFAADASVMLTIYFMAVRV
jgi:membrane protease YdiL (CAAX protease family)